MADKEPPKPVRRANDNRWKELARMAKIERRLMKMLIKGPGQRPIIPGPSLHWALPEQNTLERCGTYKQCNAPDCGTCDSCQGEGTIATRAQSREVCANTHEHCQAQQKRCASWLDQNCKQSFMYMNNWDKGVASAICPCILSTCEY